MMKEISRHKISLKIKNIIGYSEKCELEAI